MYHLLKQHQYVYKYQLYKKIKVFNILIQNIIKIQNMQNINKLYST
jgi:hypothetical protein